MNNDNLTDNTQKDPQDWKTGNEPMTGAQRSHIETLSGKSINRDMTKAEASELIDKLHAQKNIKANS